MDKFWEGVGTFLGALFWFGFIFIIGYGIFAPSDNSSSSKPSSSQSSAIAPETSEYNSYDSSDYSDGEPYEEPAYDSSADYDTYNTSYDMDCEDFDSWDEAQYHYENVSDDNLDGDDDGVACESLQ